MLGFSHAAVLLELSTALLNDIAVFLSISSQQVMLVNARHACEPLTASPRQLNSG